MDAGDVLRAMAGEKDPRSLLPELAVPPHPQLDLPPGWRGAPSGRAVMKLLSGPEVGLLSWVQSVPSPSPSS